MSHLYTPVAGEPMSKKFDYSFRLKKGAWEIIRNAKGWKTDAQGALELEFTRGYISQILSNKEEITGEVILRLAVLMGNIEQNWWIHFEIVKNLRKGKMNHQRYNQAKYNKQIPYAPLSMAAVFRSHNLPTETRTTKKEFKMLDNTDS